MKFMTVCFAILMSTALLVSAQSFGFSQFAGDFGGPSAFGAAANFAPAAGVPGVRDPRQNRGTGPVVFPPPPAGGPVESSGVVVGASGYGFVPPQQPQKKRIRYGALRPPPKPLLTPLTPAKLQQKPKNPLKPTTTGILIYNRRPRPKVKPHYFIYHQPPPPPHTLY